MNENKIGDKIIDAAIALHKELGPGLLETVYEVILAHKLKDQGLRIERQIAVSPYFFALFLPYVLSYNLLFL